MRHFVLKRIPPHGKGRRPFSSAVVSFCTLSEEALTEVTAHTRGCQCRHWSGTSGTSRTQAVLTHTCSEMHMTRSLRARALAAFLPCSFGPHCTDCNAICAYVHPPFSLQTRSANSCASVRPRRAVAPSSHMLCQIPQDTRVSE